MNQRGIGHAVIEPGNLNVQYQPNQPIPNHSPDNTFQMQPNTEVPPFGFYTLADPASKNAYVYVQDAQEEAE